MATIARVDHEYAAEAFWSRFHERAGTLFRGTELHTHCVELMERDEVTLQSEAAATDLLAFCRAIPGYSDGPEYAREAVIFSDV